MAKKNLRAYPRSRCSKMFKRKNNTREEKLFTLDIFLDHEIFDKFRLYARNNGLDEDKALIQVLQRGMDNYWLLEYKQLKENFPYAKQLLSVLMQDDEALTWLEQENEKMRELLVKCQPKNSGSLSKLK